VNELHQRDRATFNLLQDHFIEAVNVTPINLLAFMVNQRSQPKRTKEEIALHLMVTQFCSILEEQDNAQASQYCGHLADVRRSQLQQLQQHMAIQNPSASHFESDGFGINPGSPSSDQPTSTILAHGPTPPIPSSLYLPPRTYHVTPIEASAVANVTTTPTITTSTSSGTMDPLTTFPTSDTTTVTAPVISNQAIASTQTALASAPVDSARRSSFGRRIIRTSRFVEDSDSSDDDDDDDGNSTSSDASNDEDSNEDDVPPVVSVRHSAPLPNPIKELDEFEERIREEFAVYMSTTPAESTCTLESVNILDGKVLLPETNAAYLKQDEVSRVAQQLLYTLQAKHDMSRELQRDVAAVVKSVTNLVTQDPAKALHFDSDVVRAMRQDPSIRTAELPIYCHAMCPKVDCKLVHDIDASECSCGPETIQKDDGKPFEYLCRTIIEDWLRLFFKKPEFRRAMEAEFNEDTDDGVVISRKCLICSRYCLCSVLIILSD